jgi:hypothetical protein
LLRRCAAAGARLQPGLPVRRHHRRSGGRSAARVGAMPFARHTLRKCGAHGRAGCDGGIFCGRIRRQGNSVNNTAIRAHAAVAARPRTPEPAAS